MAGDLELAIGEAATGSLPSDSPVESSPVASEELSFELRPKEVASASVAEDVEAGRERPGVSRTGSGGDVVDFRTMRWWNVGILMVAETVSLGILALPSATSKLGFFPGLFLIGSFGLIATYTGWVIGQFKLAHPTVHNMADAGSILFSPLGEGWSTFGRRVFGAGSIFFLVFIMAAHILTFSVMMNVVSEHKACTVLFMIVGAVASFALCLPRTLEKVSWISVASLVSIVIAVFVTMVGVGVLHPGGSSKTVAINQGFELSTAVVAVMDIVMAYAGNVAFFGFISEMCKPAEYTKALWMLQGGATTLYIIVAAIIYYFAGVDVASPALGSASLTLQKVAYIIAIPTILVAGVINGHVAITMVFKTFRPHLMTSKSCKAIAYWVLFCLLLWLAAWMLAESIPHFDNLLGLVSALLGSWFTYGISGALWLFLHRGRWNEGGVMRVKVLANFGLVAMGCALCGMGTWASVVGIRAADGGTAWSCRDNV